MGRVTRLALAPRAPVDGTGVFDQRPITIGGFTLRSRAVEVSGTPTLDGWTAAFEFASAAHEDTPYWLGRLLVYAESREDWREKMSQAKSASGLALQTLQNLTYVARHVEEAVYQIAPSHGHAAEVAALTPKEQRAWLRQAKTEGWTTKELRDAVRTSKRSIVAKGQAATMHVVDVTVQISIEAANAIAAEQEAWEQVKALVGHTRAKVIASHARVRS